MTDAQAPHAPETGDRLNMLTAALVDAMDQPARDRFTVSVLKMIKLAEDEAQATGRTDLQDLTWLRQLLAQLIGS